VKAPLATEEILGLRPDELTTDRLGHPARGQELTRQVVPAVALVGVREAEPGDQGAVV
jgi:hypothetical protein